MLALCASYDLAGAAGFDTTGLVHRYISTTGVTLSGSNITQWDDQVGTSNTTGASGSYPTKKTLDGRTSVSIDSSSAAQYLAIPASLSIDLRSCSIYVCHRSRLRGGSHAMVSVGADPMSFYWTDTGAGANFLQVYDTASGYKTSTIMPGHGVQTAFALMGASSCVTGCGKETTTNTAMPAKTESGTYAYIGAWTPTFLTSTQEVYEVLFFSTAIDPASAQHQSILEYMSSTYGSVRYNESTYIVAKGDSITESVNTPIADTSWAYYMSQWPGNFSSFKFNNFGTGGDTVQNIAASETDWTVSLTNNSAYKNRVAIIMGGTNDINAGRTSSQVITDLTTMVSQARTAGATKVLNMTITPRTSFIGGANETTRLAVNAAIKAGTTGADWWIDWDADPNMVNSTNTVFYNGDGLHPTSTGNRYMAGIILAFLQNKGMLSNTSRGLLFGRQDSIQLNINTPNGAALNFWLTQQAGASQSNSASYINDKSVNTGTGSTGSGDYRLKPTSVCRNKVPPGTAHYPLGINRIPICNSGQGDLGAIQTNKAATTLAF